MTSHLQTIREAIVSTWLVPAIGISSGNPYPVENVGAVPCAWIGFDDDEGDITMSQDIHKHSLPITVVVARKGAIKNEMQVVETVQDALELRINTNMTLAGLIYPARRMRTIQGTVPVGNHDYIGFTMTVLCKEKRTPGFVP